VMPEPFTGGTSPPAQTSLIAGRYELVQRIGEGALFSVFRATDRETGQDIAVKCLKPALARDDRFVASLLEEARAARVLHHRNIVRVLDAGQDEHVVYVVTEYVAGTSLRDRIRRTAPLPVAVAVDIATEIADALSHAHQQGAVHGAVRPNNVLITSEGHVKVSDFGLARAISASADVELNSVLRWVQCMSPEVAEGSRPSPSSDTYSLGCVLYEMLTGSPLFPGDNAIVVALKHAREAPRPLLQANPSVPAALSAIVMQSLEKDATHRFTDATTMLAELRRVQDALRYNKPLDYTPAHVLTPVTNPPEPEYVDEDEDDVPRPLIILRNILLTLVGVGFVLIFYFMYGLLQPQKDVPVPEVIGRPSEEAKSILAQRDLQWTVMERESTRPAGEVLNQDPDPNQSVKPGRTVTLYVSRGPKMVSVPAVTEMSLERAEQIAQAVGLQVMKNGEAYSEDTQQGYVIDQIPGPNEKVKPGKLVKVTVSKGPEPEPEPPPPPQPEYPPDYTTPNYSPPPGGMAPTPPVQRTGRLRSFNISFQVPTKGYEEPVEVQIVVMDERGEATVVDEQHRLGEFVTKRIEGVGERVIIRVYLNNTFYSEEVK